MILHCSGPFKEGDPRPSGYIAWAEWADVQIAAGLRQKRCAYCSLWSFPQELSGKTVTATLQTSRGGKVQKVSPICKECDAKGKCKHY